MSNEVKLTVPADRRFLEGILDFVSDYAKVMGIQGREQDEIRLALEEALVNVIEHGFAGGAKESFHLEMSASGGGLTFLVRERGLPFDPDVLEQTTAGDVSEGAPIKGLGLKILRRYMDEVSFRSLGVEGKETNLVKRLSFEDEPLPEEEVRVEQPPLPEDLHFDVRRMRPHEALEVARLAYHAYGYTYSKLQIYDPSVIRLMNDQDTLASFVAVTDEGEIMGHAALVHHDESPKVPELGVVFVNPRFRKRGCMKRLTAWLVEEARQRKAYGLFAQGVCSHSYSQKALHDVGLQPCVLRLACAPFREYKGIDGVQGRESFITCHRYINAGPGKPLFFPQEHAEMLTRIYGWQDRGVSVSIVPKGLELSDRPLSLDFNMDSKSTASMRVRRYGKGIAAEVLLRLRQACLERMDVVFLGLDLSDPLSAQLVPEFESMGFFFAGVMPGGGGKDHLILQYLNNVKLDFRALQAGNDQGRELITYVQGCEAKSKS
ncbi:GNAT family N-acetyltransferase [Desulfovibrio ferrophilus]|uniref:Putative anti-sigma regulatory factor, serine/threonine protein kinase n=1 Tax=Desulfovibrio ferrophilus TaxID=241368 RepID=A0A2Z6AUB7_9BACT|nr:GNAT family N-acetyltransferase [Desulfovibrio ferrophilus]BBD06776.1 putative anti-sigma regulatory factor, serine/threonine protein kinase [Desulfovibrio ferrophilus]